MRGEIQARGFGYLSSGARRSWIPTGLDAPAGFRSQRGNAWRRDVSHQKRPRP